VQILSRHIATMSALVYMVYASSGQISMVVAIDFLCMDTSYTIIMCLGKFIYIFFFLEKCVQEMI
jgi:hypothetical protein